MPLNLFEQISLLERARHRQYADLQAKIDEVKAARSANIVLDLIIDRARQAGHESPEEVTALVAKYLGKKRLPRQDRDYIRQSLGEPPKTREPRPKTRLQLLMSNTFDGL